MFRMIKHIFHHSLEVLLQCLLTFLDFFHVSIEFNAYMKKIQKRQQALQQDFQRMMKDMFDHTEHFMIQFPMMMPMVIVPEQNKSVEKKNAAATPEAKSS